MFDVAVSILAPIINCVYQIPQLFKIIKTKSVDDISLYALCLLLINNILWLIHSYFINDISLFLSALFSLGINIPLICLYLKHQKYEKK
jgi:uncharacterized protein with PQ loop repeat